MSDDIINQAISESTSTQVESSTPIENPQVETKEATEEKPPTETHESEDVPFPKKAVNALSRRDKQIGKLQAQLAADRAELAKFREAKSPANNSPTEDGFDNYGEYLKAVARHEAQQEFSQNSKKQEEAATTAQQEAWQAERTDYITNRAKEALETIPDYKQLFMENADILQSLPPHIEKAFYESDAPELAFYALAKEGKLDSLFEMSPGRAAIEIGKAEMRGEALSKAKQITKAPAPLERLKGTGSSNKSLETMSSQDLLKWLGTK